MAVTGKSSSARFLVEGLACRYLEEIPVWESCASRKARIPVSIL